jgi:hypothetical protein
MGVQVRISVVTSFTFLFFAARREWEKSQNEGGCYFWLTLERFFIGETNAF